MKKILSTCGVVTVVMLFCVSLSYAQKGIYPGRPDKKAEPHYDFVFNIPVELHKIPAYITHFSVDAAVFNKEFNPGSYGPTPAPGSRVGYGISEKIPIVNGEYIGTITVRFNGGEMGLKPEAAIVYEAYIVFMHCEPGHLSCQTVYMREDTPYPPDPQQSNVQQVYGRLPSASAGTPPSSKFPRPRR